MQDLPQARCLARSQNPQPPPEPLLPDHPNLIHRDLGRLASNLAPQARGPGGMEAARQWTDDHRVDGSIELIPADDPPRTHLPEPPPARRGQFDPVHAVSLIAARGHRRKSHPMRSNLPPPSP